VAAASAPARKSQGEGDNKGLGLRRLASFPVKTVGQFAHLKAHLGPLQSKDHVPFTGRCGDRHQNICHTDTLEVTVLKALAVVVIRKGTSCDHC